MSATKPLLKSHSSGSLGSMVSAAISSTASIATSPSGSISASSPLFASHSNHHNHHHHHYNQRSARLIRLCCALALFATAIAAVCVLLHWLALSGSGRHAIGGRHLHRGQQPHTAFAPVTLDVRDMPRILLASDADSADERQPNCSHWDCFDVYRCGQAGSADRMSVYVYPLRQFVDAAAPDGAVAPLSRDFHRVLRAIRESVYYTPDPHEACVFVPSVDLLNQNRVDVEAAGKALATLEYWDNGDNHLLFNMASGTAPHFNTSLDVRTDRAMVAGAGYDTWTYRHAFDLAIPFYRPGLSDARVDNAATSQRPHLLITAQLNLFARHNRILQELAYDHPNDVLVLQQCRDAAVDNTPKSGGAHASTSGEQRRAEAADGPEWRCAFASQQRHIYPAVLTSGRFCLVARGARLLPLNLMESMAAGCVPVFAADNLVLPFAEILDWTLASVSIRETNLHSIVARLQAISPERTAELRTQVLWLYERYFSSLERVVDTALAQLNDRIFPHVARDQRAWNQPRTDVSTQNPLFLSLTATKAPGFTAVILTYDRVESLFTLIEKLSIVPSLHKILVVWNNQRKAPPHLSQFPKIAKPLQVIRTTANKLSNRFYPYAAIETEALLTIDDDIVMLTADELEFGFEVWREFPDRIVGFPSRTHVWDNTTGRWRYESEWTNEISMVLTGAAFHHKYWSHMYTTAMPGDIKQWVDDHMNCEDIAMNFLVANITGQPPIKVAPRKKFKCPECTNTEMLSADLNHMMERSACIDRFAKIYGRMPLRTVEFRADPVLYKDNFPEKLKRFNDIGSL